MIPELLDYYDYEVTQLISDKYGYSHMDALRLFVTSETHRMMENPKLEMWQFGPPAILELWEAEKITGDPRNSIYVRGD